MANSKGLEKWFPLIPGYRVHNNIDIQGEIRIEIMFYDQVGEKKWFTINGQPHVSVCIQISKSKRALLCLNQHDEER